MSMFLFFFLFFVFIHADQSCIDDENGYCELMVEEENERHEKDKYKPDERWIKLIMRTEEAVSDYQECIQEDCSCHKGVMDRDMSVWEEGIPKESFDEAVRRDLGIHYQIINHELYREKDCTFPFRCGGIEYFLLKIVKDLPDMEMVINVWDWPQSSTNADPLPVLSFSKPYADNYDIMYPAWTFWAGGPAVWPIYPVGLGRWDEQRIIVPQEAEKWPWNKKEGKGFFRGSRTSEERDPLILLSRSEPTMVDAKYTKNQSWRSNHDSLGEDPAEEIKLEDHCKYKYLFNFRGVAASFRFKHLFLCNSLVFHVGDEWLEFFYPAMKPWVHYIPVRQDMTDVKELLQFVLENDGIAQQIAARGRQFIWDHLRMEDVECYWENLLKRYAKLITWKATRNKKLMLVQPEINDDID